MTWICAAMERAGSMGAGRLMKATDDTVVEADEISGERL